METHTIAYSKSHRDNGVIQARGKIDDEANTLSTGDGCGNQSTQNFVFTKVDMNKEQEERILKLASVDNTERKNHVQAGTVPDVEIDIEDGKCIATRHLGRNGSLVSDIASTVQVAEIPHVTYKEEPMSDIKLLAGQTAPNQDRKSLYVQQGRVYSSEGVSPTLTTYSEKNAHVVGNEGETSMQIAGELRTDEGSDTFVGNIFGTLRCKDSGGDKVVIDPEPVIKIRKLTPVECERLQGYPDGHTSLGHRSDGTTYEISNTQRYKMCGNGVSSPVPAFLFPAIFGTEPIRVMSLFSGCGGTELSLPSNFQVVGHCEFDKHASAVLNYHYPNIPNFHDVTDFVNKENVPEFDMLVGGFPCQSWSIAGLRKGFSDQRGQLIYNVFDILRKHKPKFLCLENVKGLLSKDNGDAFEAIMEYLSSLGYDLDFEVVNSKHFGLAQNRERVFIFGKLK